MSTEISNNTQGADHHKQNSNEYRPKPGGLAAFKSIFSFTRSKDLVLLSLAVVLAAVAGTVKPLSSIFVGRLMNSLSGFASGKIDDKTLAFETRPTIIDLVTLGITACVVKGFFYASWSLHGEHQARVVREGLFSTLVNRDLVWFESQICGINTLLSRIQTQVRDFQLGVSHPLGLVVSTLFQAVFSLVVAFRYNWKLALVLLSTFPIIAFILSFISSGLQSAGDDQQNEMVRATKQTVDAITNLTLLKCYDGLPRAMQAYRESLCMVFQHYRVQAFIAAKQIAFMRIAAGFLVLTALSFGAYLIHNSHANPGDILSTFWCCTLASKAFSDILVQILVLEKGRASATHLSSLITDVNESFELQQNGHGKKPMSFNGNIHFRDVCFAYPSDPNREVLKCIEMFFPARQITFVIGQSGSGKSTIGSLLLKLYPLRSGQITIDDTDLTDLDTNWLRNNVTLVPQDSVLFHGSIADNIGLGYHEPSLLTRKKLMDSLRFAVLEDTVDRLPHGIDTKVGKDGATISGGQRQRIALARARVRDAAVLILDEPTSALDSSTKSCLMGNIRRWRRNRTTIIITHDLTLIGSDDFVYLIKEGRVAKREQFSNFELLPGCNHGFGHEESLGTRWSEDRNREVANWDNANVRKRSHYSSRKSNVSGSSLGAGINSPVFEDCVGLLNGQCSFSPNRDPRRNAFRSLHIFQESGRQSNRRRQLINGGLSENVSRPSLNNDEFELARVAKLHELRNRLTMAEATRPYSTYPMISTQPSELKSKLFVNTTPIEIGSLARKDYIQTSTDIALPKALSNRAEEVFSAYKILLTVWPSLDEPQRYQLLLGLVLASIYSAIPATSAWVIVHLFETFYQVNNWIDGARKWSLVFIGIVTSEAAMAFSIHLLFETLAQAWINSLRLTAFVRVLDQPKSWFDGQSWSQSEICTTIDRSAEELRNLLGRFVPFVLIATFMVLITTIWCFLVCWRLALVGAGIAPGVYAVSKIFDMTSTFWESRSTDAATKISNVFAESFADVRTVRALTLEYHFHRRYMATTSSAFVTGFKRSVSIGVCFGISESMLPFLTAGIFQYAIVVARSGEFSVKDILVVLTLLISTIVSAGAIFAFIPQISSSIESGSRISRLMSLPVQTSQGNNLLNHEDDSRVFDIELFNITFAYPTRPETSVLKNLSLKVQGGQCTALVGASGSGKSTILSLILGLYAVERSSAQPSSVAISGHDIKGLNIRSLRSYIGYVSQQPVVFPMSIRENILYGVDNSVPGLEDRLHEAAKSAKIHDFIVSLANGYDTIIGEGGLNISGGQAQRITVARAFARRPRILLMDEPTSALDLESSKLIKNLVREYMKGNGENKPTIIIVTHYPDMMMIADQIIVLEAGSLVEQGTPEALLRSREYLYRLINSN